MVIIKSLLLVSSICLPVFLLYGKLPARKLYNGDVKLIEAYTQRTLPGRKTGTIINTTHIIIIWNNKEYPTKFFWYCGGHPKDCNFNKVHKAHPRNGMFSPNTFDYERELINPENIKPGDTIDVSPFNRGDMAASTDLPSQRTNTLIYYLHNNKNLFRCRIDNLTRKHDVAMP